MLPLVQELAVVEVVSLLRGSMGVGGLSYQLMWRQRTWQWEWNVGPLSIPIINPRS